MAAAVNINPVTVFVNKIFESKLKGLAKQDDITQDAITKIIADDQGLTAEFNQLDEINVVTEAKAQFNTYVTNQIKNISEGFASSTSTYKPNQKEIVIPLRGLAISNPAELQALQKNGITKAELINSDNDLKLTIDTTKTLPANIQFAAVYKGVSHMFQIGLNRAPLNSPTPAPLKDKAVKFPLESDVILEKSTVEAFNKDVNQIFTIEQTGQDVTFKLKEGKTIDKDKDTDVILDVTAGGKTEKLKFTIKPETAGEAESSAMWWTKIGLMGVGALAALGGFFMGDQENQGPKIATGLGVGALVAGLFMYFGWGSKQPDAAPAKQT